MSWVDVLIRDLTSVYRSRTGTAVTALVGLCTLATVSLLATTDSVVWLAVLGALVTLVAVTVAVFAGTPRTVAGVLGVFACFSLVLVGLLPNPDTRPPTAEAGVLTVGSLLSFVLPLVAVLATYAALVGERERGSVRFLYGLPNSRDDVYLGKYLSRATVVLVPLVVGVLLAGLVTALTYQQSALLGMVGLAVVSIPYALLFVGLGLSASGFAETDNRAVAIVVGAFVLFRAVWPAVQWLGLQGMEDPYPRPEWYFWVGRLNPMNAYVKLTTLFVEGPVNHPLLTRPETYDGMTRAAGSLATSHGFALVVLLAWTVAAPLLCLTYYRNRDLL